MASQKQSWVLPVAIGVSLFLYFFLFYETQRHQFFQLMALFFGLFVLYGVSYRFFAQQEPGKRQITYLIGGAIAFRLVALFALPELSDDYFRFLWDGHLLSHGTNPFFQVPSAYTPESFPALGLSPELYEGLNSKDYFTIYPPVCQGIFFLATWVFPHSIYGGVVFMKLFFFLMEIVTIGVLIKLLKHVSLPVHLAALYAFNPLIIAEFVGNLHFETLMLGFLLMSILLLVKGKWQWAALPFGLAICSKLLPLMMLPLFIQRLGWQKAIAFGAIAGGVTLVAFLPLLDIETLLHLFSSISLYFQTFEFNASIYYLVRAAGYYFVGYNIIGVAGKALAGITLISILVFAWKEKQPRFQTIPGAMMWVLVIYFAFAAIVHPWYICPLVALCLFTDYRFPVLWTALLPLTYITYRTSAYEENLWLVAGTYLIVVGYLALEWKIRKPKSFSPVE